MDRLVHRHLGETVRCSLWGVDPWSDVPGVFSAEYVLASAGDAGVVSAGPAVFVRLSALPFDPYSGEEMRIERGGVHYRVREARKDGEGGVVLLLTEID